MSNKKLEEFWLRWHGRVFTGEAWRELIKITEETVTWEDVDKDDWNEAAPALAQRCNESAGHLIAGHSYFACVLPKGHEGEHQRGGTCFAHGEYVGSKCPEWPKCIEKLSAPAPARLTGEQLKTIAFKHRTEVYGFADKFDFDAIAADLNLQMLGLMHECPSRSRK